jgi:hypothetical protein
MATALKRELARLRREADALARQPGSRRVTELPPVEEFRRLPRARQIELLIAYDPPPREHPGPPLPGLDVFESLPIEEMRRIFDEYLARIPRDEHREACFMCLDAQQQVEVCMLSLKKSPPPEEVPARLRRAPPFGRRRKGD